MTAAKIAVSLPVHAVDRARAAVKAGRAKSVSAYIADALQQKAKLDDLAGLLDEMLAESGGPMTDAERREVDRLAKLGDRPRARKARR